MFIPDLGSRIQKQQQKMRGENLLFYLFLYPEILQIFTSLVPVGSSGSQHNFIFVQGYTQEQLEREENVESIQLNVQYQPTATRKVRI
jgi:hypothetical protein